MQFLYSSSPRRQQIQDQEARSRMEINSNKTPATFAELHHRIQRIVNSNNTHVRKPN